MASLLVTNDFPPKLGGIQSYLYELWRRLPPAETTVLTTPYRGDERFDAAQRFRIERTRARVLLPTPGLVRHVEALARDTRAHVVFLDPMLPLGLIGPRLRAAPYVVITHGAEVTVPGRLSGTSGMARHVLRGASAVLAAGDYPAREAQRAARAPIPCVVVPPGVDTDRFRPLPHEERRRARTRFGLHPEAPLVLGVSRLVPRKGFDVLIDAMPEGAQLAIAGAGRDRRRLERRRRKRRGSGVCFLGRVPADDLPALYASADVFAMPCRERWGGLEAEGFGIVFLEAAACAVPAVAGRSGGSDEAVVDGETGFVVASRNVAEVRDALRTLLGDDSLRARMGSAAYERATGEFSYDRLVGRVHGLASG